MPVQDTKKGASFRMLLVFSTNLLTDFLPPVLRISLDWQPPFSGSDVLPFPQGSGVLRLRFLSIQASDPLFRIQPLHSTLSLFPGTMLQK